MSSPPYSLTNSCYATLHHSIFFLLSRSKLLTANHCPSQPAETLIHFEWSHIACSQLQDSSADGPHSEESAWLSIRTRAQQFDSDESSQVFVSEAWGAPFRSPASLLLSLVV